MEPQYTFHSARRRGLHLFARESTGRVDHIGILLQNTSFQTGKATIIQSVRSERRSILASVKHDSVIFDDNP